MDKVCPHLSLVLKVDKEELLLKAEGQCSTCGKKEKLWGCLQGGCQYIGCGESIHDHSTKHYKKLKHSVTVNLNSFRIWCYACELEVHLPSAFTSTEMKALRKEKRLQSPTTAGQNTPKKTPEHHKKDHSQQRAESVPTESQNIYGTMQSPLGLTGLRNMGNTCYMNSALQAISNCSPLINYFLHEFDYLDIDIKPSMARSYRKLIHDIWGQVQHQCVTPTGVHQTLKSINPSFRGYHQQDAQEFLRCFMDRLHEELKYMIPKWTNNQASVDRDDLQNSIHTGDEPMEIDEIDHVPSPSTESSSTDSFTVVSEQDLTNPQSSMTPGISAASPHTRVQTETQENLTQLHGNDESASKLSHSNKDESLPWQQRNQDSHFRNSRSNLKYHKPKKSVKKSSYKYKSIISEIFDGELRSSVQCLTCDQVSHTRETFQDLSLPIPGKDDLIRLHGTSAYYPSSSPGTLAVVPGFKGPCSEATRTEYIYNAAWNMWEWVKSWFWGPQITLNDCLSAFFSADELKGDNMYSCNKCNKLRNGMKYCKLLKVPEVLCIHLKRFRHEYLMSYSSKISSPVSFPITGLNLRQFLAQDSPSTCTTYDLSSVIVHLGNAGGGHYTSYAKNIVDNNWYEFDDQFITQVPESTVANAEAYVLFYCKSSPEAVRSRERIIQLSETSHMDVDGSSSNLLQFHISTNWLYKFLNFAEPGPIDNSSFICPHLDVLPSAAESLDNLQTLISKKVWQELHEKFGGGPAVTTLSICSICEEEQNALERRRVEEKETFLQIQRTTGEMDSSMYINLDWFREWEDFLNGKFPEPPGEVDNWPICYTKEGKHILRKNSSHAPIPKKSWDFLISIYDGGPEVVQRSRKSSATSPNRSIKTSPRSPSPTEHKIPQNNIQQEDNVVTTLPETVNETMEVTEVKSEIVESPTACDSAQYKIEPQTATANMQ
uniref:ubiquitin carboxyl-terminal hydrolase 20-like n=1 Tax=Styela clava TaxID=7725 RepID=UPI00193AC930|nr:ubiquitin carboxyl-terminal hydrolase 20-like [Styela clava]